jgi:DNA-binding LacI/PurR family transcriptional regulator
MIRPDWLADDTDSLVLDLRAAVPPIAGRAARQDGTAVIFDMDHTEATYAAAEFLRTRFARIVLITPRDTVAVDVQMVTRQGILRRLAEQRIEIVTLSIPVWSVSIESGILEYANVYTAEIGRVTDVAFLSYATPRAPNVALYDTLRERRVMVRLVGDCQAPLELLAATATGHAAGEEV